ncbi:MAG: hypothetical protein VKI83_11695 [Synechococcaceae cyanobacterium]|nr:hypothetical protein [Synechococcaceae cyanobacterium]
MAIAPLIDRSSLARLNALRDRPGWIRLSCHLLLIVAAGLV